MIKLYQFAPAFGLPNASSFCLKLETYLRMVGIPFESVYSIEMGKHSSEEIYAIGIADLTALSDFLSDKPFFFGSEPTSLDAAAYGILANILWAPFDSPIKNKAQQLANIVAYCTRMRDQYYPIEEVDR
jgi:Glutathione S-transferase, C-terminal domain